MSSQKKKKKMDLWRFQNIEIIGQLNSATLFHTNGVIWGRD